MLSVVVYYSHTGDLYPEECCLLWCITVIQETSNQGNVVCCDVLQSYRTPVPRGMLSVVMHYSHTGDLLPRECCLLWCITVIQDTPNQRNVICCDVLQSYRRPEPRGMLSVVMHYSHTGDLNPEECCLLWCITVIQETSNQGNIVCCDVLVIQDTCIKRNGVCCDVLQSYMRPLTRGMLSVVVYYIHTVDL